MEYRWIMQLMMAFYVLKHSCQYILSLFLYVFLCWTVGKLPAKEAESLVYAINNNNLISPLT